MIRVKGKQRLRQHCRPGSQRNSIQEIPPRDAAVHTQLSITGIVQEEILANSRRNGRADWLTNYMPRDGRLTLNRVCN